MSQEKQNQKPDIPFEIIDDSEEPEDSAVNLLKKKNKEQLEDTPAINLLNKKKDKESLDAPAINLLDKKNKKQLEDTPTVNLLDKKNKEQLENTPVVNLLNKKKESGSEAAKRRANLVKMADDADLGLTAQIKNQLKKEKARSKTQTVEIPDTELTAKIRQRLEEEPKPPTKKIQVKLEEKSESPKPEKKRSKAWKELLKSDESKSSRNTTKKIRHSLKHMDKDELRRQQERDKRRKWLTDLANSENIGLTAKITRSLARHGIGAKISLGEDGQEEFTVGIGTIGTLIFWIVILTMAALFMAMLLEKIFAI